MEVGELLPRLSILTVPRDGGLFLLPFSGGYPRLTLSVILPYDARTFLTGIPFGNIPRGRPTKLPAYYTMFPFSCQYFFHWEVIMRPADPSISPAALSRILDALEVSLPTTRRGLAEATGLGQSTVDRAVTTCLTHSILRCETGISPDSGRPCRLLHPDTSLLLPILTMTHEYGIIRVLDMDLTPVATATVELYPASPPEESARLLARRLLTLLRGCGKKAVTSPVLVTDGSLPTTILRDVMTHTLGQAPLSVMGHGEAVARAVKSRSLPEAAESLLFVFVGEGAHACLLLKDREGLWHPSPLGDSLTPTLLRTLRSAEASAEGIRRSAAVFLTDLCRFLRPDLLCVEDGRSILPDAHFYSFLLPDGVEILVSHAKGELTKAEIGAALAGRRMVWDKILLG